VYNKEKRRGKMKYTLYIDEEREEEIIVYARSRNALTESIERLINEEKLNTSPIIGYIGDDIIEIDPSDVHCFFIEDKKLYASLKNSTVLIKRRLYEIEGEIGRDFIKINQSTLANVKHIERFSVSIGASLTVHFKNGRRDYVSRRQLKAVKERLGIK
jgi:DNA-binding LytR/AlgR family response regulator